ncbi:MAG: hypothetical protein M5U31_14565 [Acidimicrobiia bacterium]|nr:hypothetical protein [Acidimicrobiia bacterium]
MKPCELLAQDRIVVVAELSSHLDEGAGPATGCSVGAARAILHQVSGADFEHSALVTGHRSATATAPAGSETRPLGGERRVGDPPTLSETPDPIRVEYTRLIQEHLVEHGVPGHLPKRTNVDAGLVHG